MLGAFSNYLPLGDLGKIVAVCLVVAVIAPTAVSVAVAGLDLRARPDGERGRGTVGTSLIAIGVAVLGALVAAGIYALFTD
jgi:hypothetical protein